MDLSKSSTAMLMWEAQRLLECPELADVNYMCDVAGQLRKRGILEIENRLLWAAAAVAIDDQ